MSCPAKVTADSGIDALTHAIEAFTAVDNGRFPLSSGEKTVYQGRHPLADALAEKAIRLIGAHLERAVPSRATSWHAKPCRWGRRWPGSRFRTSVLRSCML